MDETDSTTINNLAIKAICIIGVINATQMINLIFSPMTKKLGGFYPAYFAVSVILSLLCLGGLWLQRRWAAWAYAAILAVNQFILLKTGFWEVTALVMPLVIVALLYQNRNQLR